MAKIECDAGTWGQIKIGGVPVRAWVGVAGDGPSLAAALEGDALACAAHHVRMTLGAPTVADAVLSALASALFGWLP